MLEPIEDQLAKKRLGLFKRLFPRVVEQASPDRPGYLLVDVFQGLCAAIAINPLYPDAFASGAHFMEYLQRPESTRTFHYLASYLTQALA